MTTNNNIVEPNKVQDSKEKSTAQTKQTTSKKGNSYAINGLVLTIITDILTVLVVGYILSKAIGVNGATPHSFMIFGFLICIGFPLKLASLILCLCGCRSANRKFSYIGLGIFVLELLAMQIFIPQNGISLIIYGMGISAALMSPFFLIYLFFKFMVRSANRKDGEK